MCTLPFFSRVRRAGALIAAAGLVVTTAAGTVAAQPAAPAHHPRDTSSRLPFPIGEVLNYRVNVSFGGNIGQGEGKVAPCNLSPNEQYAYMSMWCVILCPLNRSFP